MKSSSKILISVIAAVAVVVIVVFACLGTLVFTRFSEGVVPDADDLAQAVPYKRVLLIGVDGAGNYFRDEYTPNFHRIFAEGSINYEGWSQYPTTSAHNWTAMLHGVRYQTHHINNFVANNRKYSLPQYPSVFKVCGDLYPDAQMISLTSWYPINYGIIEDMDNLIKYNGPKTLDDDPLLTATDEAHKDAFLHELAEGLDPKIAFMYFGEVDEYGHTYGRNEDFYEAIRRVDGYIGEVYDAYETRGFVEDTLFVFVTDHGHRRHGGHGFNSVSERTVTIAVAGAKGNINAGNPSGKAVTQDVASIILYGLGIAQPETWESTVPYGVFNTLPAE